MQTLPVPNRRRIWGATIVAICVSRMVVSEAVAQSSATAHDEDIVAKKAIQTALDGWWTESMQNHDQRMAWWREARFGCFMHWGVYAVLAGEYEGQPVGGYSEHIQRKRQIDQQTYRKVAVEKFNPVEFDADAWAEHLERAGMRYLIITSKHHDGFAMFDSDVSDYNVVDATPFGRDPMRELADACRKRGIRFGFYYSQAFDWGEADGAGNDWEFNNPGGDKLIGGKDWWKTMPERLPHIQEKYVDAKAVPQIKELISKYQPDILWFDTSSKLPFSENLRILEELRGVDTNVVVNGRLARGHGRNFGDYINTGDRAEELSAVGGDWEAIPTTNESYGHHKHDHSHKDPQYFIRLMAKAVSRNGNMLLNVGPRGDGKIDEPDVAILEAIGKWMKHYGESIYGCGLTPLAIQSWGTSTYKPGKLYLHVFEWPSDGRLTVGGLKTDPESVELLTPAGGRSLAINRINSSDLEIVDMGSPADLNDNVICLSFAGEIETDPIRLLPNSNIVHRLLTFDARRSRRMGVGDGKKDQYFVTGMNSPQRKLSWTVRLNEPQTFAVSIRYASGEPRPKAGYSYRVSCGEQQLTRELMRPQRGSRIRQELIGELTLSKGTHTIELYSPDADGVEVFRPLELKMTNKEATTL